MGTWHDYLIKNGAPPEWPYPIRFGEELQEETDVLVIGGGIAGCWAAISAARTGVKVVLLEKADVRRSGCGGPGCDHWCNVPANPLSRVDPDDWAKQEMEALGKYSNGIGIQIQCRENYDTLLELEQMGGKIRDTDDEFVGTEGRDEKTKFMISPRYGQSAGYYPHPDWQKPGFNPPETRNNTVMRVWGSTFKPVLKKECLRLGVKVMDRVMCTSLLNEGGKRGNRIAGAAGFNVRTGEFVVIKAKAVIVSAGGSGQLWNIDMEHGGYSTMSPRTISSDSIILSWKAGAKMTMMESSQPLRIATGLKHKWYTGGCDASYENISLVDSDGKKLPAPTQGWADGGAMFSNAAPIVAEIRKGIEEGKYKLPFYGDFAGADPKDSDATWKLMLTEEATTQAMVRTLEQNGFDNHKDQLMNYTYIELQPSQQYRDATQGGVMTDWNLMTSVEGLYAAGNAMFSTDDHSHAAATGRYAGRKAAAYVGSVPDIDICRSQVEKEKKRILAPTERGGGIEWKELHNGICRVMQYFAGEFRNETMFNAGLDELKRIEENAVPQLYAQDPHKLMRTIEDLNMLEHAKIVLSAMKERRFTSADLRVQRLDYPEGDAEDENNYLTVTLKEDGIDFGRMPVRFWGSMKEQYEANNPDYTGVYQTKE